MGKRKKGDGRKSVTEKNVEAKKGHRGDWWLKGMELRSGKERIKELVGGTKRWNEVYKKQRKENV